jgi:hypothetical protein
MSQAFSISARRRYGLARVCTAWRVSRATVHRHRQAANSPRAPRPRPGPEGAMTACWHISAQERHADPVLTAAGSPRTAWTRCGEPI